MEYTVEKIITCSNGHNICTADMNNLETMICPVCKINLGTTRIYGIENIAKTIMFECKNDVCSISTTAKNVKAHYENCEFPLSQCGFKFKGCTWAGNLNDMKKHIKKVHNEYIETWRKINSVQMYVCFYEKKVFFVFFDFIKDAGVYSAMYIGPKNLANNFLLNVQFQDETGRGYRLCATAPCVPQQDISNCLNTEKILFSTEMMRKFVKSDGLYASEIIIIEK